MKTAHAVLKDPGFSDLLPKYVNSPCKLNTVCGNRKTAPILGSQGSLHAREGLENEFKTIPF